MRTPKLILNIIKYPEDYTGTKSIEIPKNGGSIGRDHLCTASLLDNDRFISGSHCLIHIYGDTYYISDVSTNGTLVNGLRIIKNQPVSIHDGDLIELGLYEIMLSFEMESIRQDIAADIELEKETNDPLLSLSTVMPLSESESESEDSGLETLFMDEQEDGKEKNDPLAHLDFSLEEEETLLHDENEPIKEKNIPYPSRQIQDDSECVLSHFDIPDFIPEDWLGNSLNEDPPSTELEPTEAYVEPSLIVKEERASQSIKQSLQNVHIERKAIETAHPLDWEDLDKPVSLSKEDARTQEHFNISNELGSAFSHGLGVPYNHFIFNTPHFFQQMGSALRMCIDKLQYELLDVEVLKGATRGNIKSENILELMITLNAKNLLSPHELIEQIFDELDEHKIHVQEAIKDMMYAELKTYDPQEFAKKKALESRFIRKKSLWRQYVTFFNGKIKTLNDASPTSIKTKIMNGYKKMHEDDE